MSPKSLSSEATRLMTFLSLRYSIACLRHSSGTDSSDSRYCLPYFIACGEGEAGREEEAGESGRVGGIDGRDEGGLLEAAKGEKEQAWREQRRTKGSNVPLKLTGGRSRPLD